MIDPATLPQPLRSELEQVVKPLGSLQAVVRWAFACTPPSDVAAVVVQDEYTHDVVIPWRAPLYLVFDST